MISRRLLLGLLSLFLILGLGPAPAGAQRVEPGGAPPAGSGPIDVSGFVRVIDGDTVEAYLGGKRVGIGLIGVDAPRGNTACGREAATALRTFVRGGLWLEDDPALTFDARGRRMYYAVMREGTSIGEELVRAGAAHANGQGRKHEQLAAAEADARATRRGCLWRGQQVTVDGATFMAMSLGGAAPIGAPTAPPTLAVAAASPAAALPSGFSEDVVASGLTSPTAFTFLPDGRILIAQKDGVVRISKNGALLSTPFIDISGRVNDYWDHGLLGIAADPNFATNGHVYLLYTYENNEADYSGTKTGRLARYTASGDTASTASEVVILGTSVGSSCNNFAKGADCIPSDSPSHSVGTIKFAPDGTMFVVTGDGAHFNYVDDNALRAQDLDLLSGKLLRINTSGAGLSTNPFWTGDAKANRSKVWASGQRNPFRFTLRPGTDVPYLGDVGWNTWEEINVGTKGANLGWPCYEGNARQGGYEPKAVCQALYNQGNSAVRMPLLPYDHAGTSASVTGGAFYTGTTYPSQYQGAYFYADYSDGWIRSLKVDASNNLFSGSVADFATGASGPVVVEAGPNSDLYYVAIGANELRRIRYAASSPPTPAGTGPNQPPTATISAPAATLKFKVGDVISVSGSATDPEDGAIPASGLAWRVVIKHCSGGQCHDHQLTTAGGTGGSFTAPDHEEDFHLEITLTATDSKGLTGTASVAIQPQTVQLTLATSPSALQVVYNGQAGTAPLTRSPIVGGTRTIAAPSPQGSTTFASWSDGGAQQHNVRVPATNTTYTATFSGGTTTTPVILGSCSPRPTVAMSVTSMADGRLQAVVSPGTNAATRTNALRSLEFGEVTNALVDLQNGPTGVSGDVPVTLPPNTQQAILYVRPLNPSGAITVRLTVVDDCGPWPTFVGRGPGSP